MLVIRLALILTATLIVAPAAGGNESKKQLTNAGTVALADMRDFAHHCFVVTERPQPLGLIEEWSPGYDLRWSEFEVVSGMTIRLYHATDKHDPTLRYVSVWDSGHGRYEPWRRVH